MSKKRKTIAGFKCSCGNNEAVLRLSDGDEVPGRLVVGGTDWGPMNPLLNIHLVCTKCGKKTKFENCIIESHGEVKSGEAETKDGADASDRNH